ncbi:uncharacterized protein LOC118748357 [Rhagoletis pomonella]|uniref:uncharacterized protein LOC118748357 n=1 Tax=Rhagoletis pomonella TaxID=28610 RepID=UPI001787624C|nr:uncharacterized protein LOC118748357 [Rhagoletis pomonella]
MCQLLGHTAKYCKNDPICVNCSFPPHSNSACIRTKCANCQDEHPSNSNKCTKFIQQKEILKIKIQQKCTLKQAKNKYIAQLPQTSSPSSFAGVVSNAANVPLNVQSTSLTPTDNMQSTTLKSNHIENTLPTPHITPKVSNKFVIKTPKPIVTENELSESVCNNANTSVTTKSFPSSATASNEASPAQPTPSLSFSPFTSLTKQLLKNNDYFTSQSTSLDSDVDIS